MRTADQINAAATALKWQADSLPDEDVFGESNVHERSLMLSWSEALTATARMIAYGATDHLDLSRNKPVASFISEQPSTLDGYLMYDDGREISQYGYVSV